MKKSLLVAVIHVLLVSAVWINYAWERQNLPRAWTLTAPVDPYDFFRGRYVQLGILARTEEALQAGTGELYSKDGLLYLRRADCCVSFFGHPDKEALYVRLSGTASFFIPEGISDPSILKSGEQLWVEVSIPRRGSPRPLRLAVKSADGSWRELAARNN